MSHGRKRQVANNLEQVAQDIVDFILARMKTPEEKMDHQNKLIDILSTTLEEYKSAQHPDSTLISLLEKWIIYPYTRQRNQEIEAAEYIARKTRIDDRFLIFELITDLLAKGKCESTSLNTIILTELIRNTGKYDPIDNDNRLNSLGWKSYVTKLGFMTTLKDILHSKCSAIIEDRNYEESQINHSRQEKKLAEVGRLQDKKQTLTGESFQAYQEKLKNVIGTTHNFKRDAYRDGAAVISKPESSITVTEDYQPGQKLDMSKFTNVINLIESKVGKVAEADSASIRPISETYKDAKNQLEKLFASGGKAKTAAALQVNSLFAHGNTDDQPEASSEDLQQSTALSTYSS